MRHTIFPSEHSDLRARTLTRRDTFHSSFRSSRAPGAESEAGLSLRGPSPLVSATTFDRAASALVNHGRSVAPAYAERIRGASRRLFFRRHFKFHISNLKFFPPLRSSATDAPANPAEPSVRSSAAPAIADFPSRLFPRPTFDFSPPARHSRFILNSSARHKDLPGKHGPGVFLFCRVRTKGHVLSFTYFHYISRHSTLLPKPSRERSKEGNTCKEPLFVR